MLWLWMTSRWRPLPTQLFLLPTRQMAASVYRRSLLCCFPGFVEDESPPQAALHSGGGPTFAPGGSGHLGDPDTIL